LTCGSLVTGVRTLLQDAAVKNARQHKEKVFIAGSY
jgi:hypothetical protein